MGYSPLDCKELDMTEVTYHARREIVAITKNIIYVIAITTNII